MVPLHTIAQSRSGLPRGDGGHHAAFSEVSHDPYKEEADERTGSDGHDSEEVLLGLQVLHVVEVHSEDTCDERTKADAACEHGESSIGNEQFVTRSVEPQRYELLSALYLTPKIGDLGL